MAWLSLSILTAAFLYTAVGGARDWRRFTATDSADIRRHFFRKWILDTWLALGLGAVVTTWMIGRTDLLLEPLPHTDLGATLARAAPSDSGAVSGFYVGIGIGLVAAVAVLVLRLRRAARTMRSTDRTTSPMLPRSRSEKLLAAHLSVAAGVAEELFFRAAVPVAVFTVTDSFLASLVTGVVLFGLYHYYQGVKGVLATGFIGFILTRVFLSTGNILAPMALHIFIDVWGLILFPALLTARSRRRGERLQA